MSSGQRKHLSYDWRDISLYKLSWQRNACTGCRFIFNLNWKGLSNEHVPTANKQNNSLPLRWEQRTLRPVVLKHLLSPKWDRTRFLKMFAICCYATYHRLWSPIMFAILIWLTILIQLTLLAIPNRLGLLAVLILQTLLAIPVWITLLAILNRLTLSAILIWLTMLDIPIWLVC